MRHSNWISWKGGVASVAICFAACPACSDDGVATTDGKPAAAPVGAVGAPEFPRIASEKVTKTAPAFKLATQAQVEAFAARRYGGTLPPEPTAAEIDAVVADAASTDPARKQQAIMRFRNMIYELRSVEARRDAVERMRAALGTSKRPVQPTPSGSQP